MTYQMLTASSPFKGDDGDEIYDAILTKEPPFPAHLTPDAIDFIQQLLRKKPESRLGSGENGPDQVMAHPFFKEIKWDDLYHKRDPAPFLPIIAHPTDLSNFTVMDKPETIETPERMSSRALNWMYTDGQS
jgi:classical protein kinase C